MSFSIRILSLRCYFRPGTIVPSNNVFMFWPHCICATWSPYFSCIILTIVSYQYTIPALVICSMFPCFFSGHSCLLDDIDKYLIESQCGSSLAFLLHQSMVSLDSNNEANLAFGPGCAIIHYCAISYCKISYILLLKRYICIAYISLL